MWEGRICSACKQNRCVECINNINLISSCFSLHACQSVWPLPCTEWKPPSVTRGALLWCLVLFSILLYYVSSQKWIPDWFQSRTSGPWSRQCCSFLFWLWGKGKTRMITGRFTMPRSQWASHLYYTLHNYLCCNPHYSLFPAVFFGVFTDFTDGLNGGSFSTRRNCV